MKFIASSIITAALAFALGLYLPWWTVAVAGMLTGFFIPQKTIFSFLSAFTGIFLFWGIMSFFISFSNDHILAKRIALLITKRESPFLIIIVTALAGGVTSGLSATTARSLVLLFKK